MNLQCRSCVVRDWRLTDKAALIRFAERRMIAWHEHEQLGS